MKILTTDWSEIIELSIKPDLFNTKRIMVVYKISSPFKPSIKLLPLIRISSKTLKKIVKNLLSKMISNNYNSMSLFRHQKYHE